MSSESESSGNSPSDGRALVSLHLRLGWWSLLVFLTLGLVLESLHGFKVNWYLDADSEPRRLMWTLAHVHGTLLSLVHLAFCATLSLSSDAPPPRGIIASRCLISAGLLMPLGFFLGGVNIYHGDPGLGVLLVLPGGALLFVAVLLTALGTSRKR